MSELLQRRLRRAQEACALRGAGDGKAEDGFRAAHRVRGDVRIRLRQDPPVTADRVTDPKRSVLRGTGEEKWYHGHEGSSSGAYY